MCNITRYSSSSIKIHKVKLYYKYYGISFLINNIKYDLNFGIPRTKNTSYTLLISRTLWLKNNMVVVT